MYSFQDFRYVNFKWYHGWYSFWEAGTSECCQLVSVFGCDIVTHLAHIWCYMIFTWFSYREKYFLTCHFSIIILGLKPGDETTYTLDTYPGHSLDTCDIYIDFLMHFRSIFDCFDILWFISNSRCTSDRTVRPITKDYQSHHSVKWLSFIKHPHGPMKLTRGERVFESEVVM